MDDRRKDARRPLDYDVTCYIDGARLDAHALNVSQRGAFVGTELGRPVPVGSLAGLVFISETSNIGTTFLFGRVIRQQDHPIRGFAVRWEKAVSAGKVSDFKSFLLSFLGVEDPEIEEEVVGPGGSGVPMTRCVYRFEPFDAEALAKMSDEESSESFDVVRRGQPEVDLSTVPDQGFAPVESGLELNGINFEIAPEPPARRGPRPGSAASEIESFIGTLDVSDEEMSNIRIGSSVEESPIHVPPVSVRDVPVHAVPPVNPAVVAEAISCDMDGVVVVNDSRLNVVITGLSASSAVIRSQFMPIDAAAPVTLEVAIGSRKGVTTIRCHGRVSGVQRGPQGGFTMAFSRLDEGESSGIFSRYLKWLEFNGTA